ncbi:MAG TPA: hypothetical protein VGS80_02120 [Ktedonobacterales bacterium]|nr:hypothetical protein [Ktedonobacterales bacterium]
MNIAFDSFILLHAGLLLLVVDDIDIFGEELLDGRVEVVQLSYLW